MEWKFSKNEKVNKVILVVLMGVMLLVIVMPMKQGDTGGVGSSASAPGKEEAGTSQQSLSDETRLTSMLEKTYGSGTVSVMVYESEGDSEDYYGSMQKSNSITGVLIVISDKVVTETTISDITLAVCALFDLPAHKVAVLVKR